MDNQRDRRFLFEYRFNGEVFGFELIADSASEAKERIKAVSWADFKGEIFAKVPVSPKSIWKRLFT